VAVIIHDVFVFFTSPKVEVILFDTFVSDQSYFTFCILLTYLRLRLKIETLISMKDKVTHSVA